MTRDFFDPTPKQQNVVLVDAATLREAERLIESCNPEDAQIPFDSVLDRVTGSDPSVTDYILESIAELSFTYCGGLLTLMFGSMPLTYSTSTESSGSGIIICFSGHSAVSGCFGLAAGRTNTSVRRSAVYSLT